MSIIISFEGIPGVGKTTLVNKIHIDLLNKGVKVANIKELDLIDESKSRIMEKALRLFFSSDDRYLRQFDPHIDTYFSQAVRYLICKEVIDINKNRYDVFLEDRGVDTYMSFAMAGFKYQNKMDFDKSFTYLCKMNSPVNEVADYTILLLDSVENCYLRALKRENNQILNKDKLYLEYVNKAYLYIAEKNKERIKKFNIDGKNEQIVYDLVMKEVERIIGKKI